MKKLIKLSAILLASIAISAHADWEPEMDAKERAELEAARKQEAARQAEMQAMKNDAQMKYERGFLGAEAQGKSDAEVTKLYNAKIAAYQKQGADAQKMMDAFTKGMAKQDVPSAASQGAAVKSMTGKSMEELSKMSDAELDALANDMEKKYGNAE